MYKSKIKEEYQTYHYGNEEWQAYFFEDKEYLVLGNMWIGKVLIVDQDTKLITCINGKALTHYNTGELEYATGYAVKAKSNDHAIKFGLHGEFQIIAVADEKLLIKSENGKTYSVYPSKLQFVE